MRPGFSGPLGQLGIGKVHRPLRRLRRRRADARAHPLQVDPLVREVALQEGL